MLHYSNNSTRPMRAQQLWMFLIGKAHNRQIVTYAEVAEMMGYDSAHVLSQILGHVMYFCRANKLPALTVIVVNQQTGLPSFDVELDMNRAREEVFAYDWFDIVTPTPEQLHTAYRSQGES